MSFSAMLDPVLNPVMSIPSPWNLFLISFIITSIVTLAYKFFTDQKLMKELKGEMKSLQKEMKEFKNHPEKMMAAQKKVMEKNMKYMMQSFKPTIITMIPIIFIFTWLRAYYVDAGDPAVLFGLSWFWSYLIVTLVLSMSMRKLLKLH